MCFEVAEHIPERFTEQFIDTLASSGDTVVMTAAEPGQGGTHHINEQPREFWYRKFESRGMEYDPRAVDTLRQKMNPTETTWIPENLIVFRSSTE
jgi:hypothetical protein